MWKLGLASISAAAASVFTWRHFQDNLPFPRLTQSALEGQQAFLLYIPSKSLDASNLVWTGFSTFSLAKAEEAEDLGLVLPDSKASLYIAKKAGDKFLVNSLDFPEKLEKWLKLHKQPYLNVSSTKELLYLLKTRKKSEFLDSFVACYVPEKDEEKENKFRDLITYCLLDDPTNNILSSIAKPHLKFIRVKDFQTAKELGIEEGFKVLRIKDSRGWFHGKKPKSAYVHPDEIRNYVKQKLQQEFKVNGHEMQFDLKIFMDKYELTEENDPSNKKFSDLKSLAENVTLVDPLMCPLWSVKDLQMITPKLLHFVTSKTEPKLLVISINKDHEERDLSSLQYITSQLKLEEFARKNPDVLVVIGYPEFIYHLPIKNTAIYHYQPIEVRMFTLEKNKVVKSALLEEDMSLEDLLNSEENFLETSMPASELNAEVLTRDEMYEKVLATTDRCYFVMHCSKSCPACSYQMPYFEEAAKHSTDCKFARYYVSNQHPVYKGPNATPTYYLYLPGRKEPVQFEPRKHGLDKEKMLGFIDTHLNSN